MKYTLSVCLLISLWANFPLRAQKPFTEGIISYHVIMETADHQDYEGIYTFTFKGTQIKKELKLDNGYSDVVLYNCGRNTVYSLQNRNGKKFAIQLSMADYERGQQKFSGFRIKNERQESKKIAGYNTLTGEIGYNDGSVSLISYTKEWYPAQPVTFERFPDARFFPLSFSYTDEQGMKMTFEAVKIDASPVENAVFSIPPDYKIISYNEYKEMSK